MDKLTRDDLYPLEEYAEIRAHFRARVMAHKKNRVVDIGEHATLYFEDRLTMHYQIQEMLRVEKIFESQGIQEELDAYNPLIPDGTNLKATFMLEYRDVEERRTALEKLLGVEDRVWMEVGGERIYAVADEDLERANADKTSSVHFLRFELSAQMISAVGRGASFGFGIDHPEYTAANCPVAEQVRDCLAADLDQAAG